MKAVNAWRSRQRVSQTLLRLYFLLSHNQLFKLAIIISISVYAADAHRDVTAKVHRLDGFFPPRKDRLSVTF